MARNGTSRSGLALTATLILLGAMLSGTTPAGAASVKRVACALPYVQGGPNFFCSNLHQILFILEGYTSNTDTVVAELLAMDENGNVLQSKPVHAGDYVRMTSLTSFPARITQKNNFFTVNAPIAMVHVKAFTPDGSVESEAFCSNIPALKVLQPNNTVINVTNPEDDVVHVLAAIPLIDASHLTVQVDGVDLLALLGVGNPTSCTLASPCGGGPFIVNGNPVTISNLVVDSGGIGQYAANTVSFDIAGLGCGGHRFVLDSAARAGSRTRFVSPTCHDDPIKANGVSSGFGITVEKPLDQETGLAFPVEVKGEVCSGRPIAVLNVNGQTFDIDEGSNVVIPGNGTTTADTYKFPFDIHVNQTDLASDLSSDPGAARLTTFDLGTNRLVVGASDDVGNRTFLTRFFGTGTTLNPGIDIAAATTAVQTLVQQALEGVGPQTLVEVPDAFAFVLGPAALQQQIDERCKAAKSAMNDFKGGIGWIFHDKLLQTLQPDALVHPNDPAPALLQIPLCKAPDPPCGTTTNIKVNPDCSCEVSVPVWVTRVDVDPNDITCPLVFEDGVIHATVNLPSLTVHIEASKDGRGTPAQCQVDLCVCVPFTDDCACACVERTTVRATSVATVSGINVTFDITEASVLSGTPAPPPPCPAPGKVDPAHPERGCLNTGSVSPDPPEVDSHFGEDNGTNIECVVGVICELASIAINAVVGFVTDLFGDEVNPGLGLADINLDPDFVNQLGTAQPDPIALKKMGINEEKVKDKNQTVAGLLSSVKISPSGLRAGLKGTFATNVVDPEVQQTPGATITHPPLPILPVPNAGDVAILVSTDALNMLSAGMTVGGALKTTCKTQTNDDGSTKTLGDLLPHDAAGNVDCDSLENDKPALAAVAQGVCHGINLAACESVTAADPNPSTAAILTAIKQGACHATKGDNCNAVPVSSQVGPRLAEQATCRVVPNLNLRKDHQILFCTRQDIPPSLLPTGGGGALPVTAILRILALSVGIVIDRDNLGFLETSLDNTPNCGPKTRQGQCAVFEACLNLNADFEMQFVPPSEAATCNGDPGIKNIFKHVQGKVFPGVLCSASSGGAADQDVASDSAKTKVVDEELPTAAQQAAPPLCMKGLDLGNLVSCNSQVQLLTAETNADLTTRDFLGVTCSVGP